MTKAALCPMFLLLLFLCGCTRDEPAEVDKAEVDKQDTESGSSESEPSRLVLARTVIPPEEHRANGALEKRCQPKLIKSPPPDWDEYRVREGEQSSGYSPLVSFQIQESGEVTDAVLERSSGFAEVDRAVLGRVKGSRFNERRGCGVIETKMSVTIHWR